MDRLDDRRTMMKGLAALGVLPALSGAALASGTVSPNDIDEAVVAAAERLLGLSFTEKERRTMLPGLRRAIGRFGNLQSRPIGNDEPPASVFRTLRRPPLASGSAPAAAPIDVADLGPEAMLLTRPIRELAGLLRAGRLTCVRLTEIALDRMKRHDPTLHCVVTPLAETALAEAAQRDAELKEGRDRGLLHGIPWGAKDLFAARGAPTTWGAKPFADQVIDRDAHVVSRLRDAGAVLVAKLSTGALAMGDRWFAERTRNPWDPERGSSGSSAGPASAVAAGLVPFALGSETLGSIVSPSTRCGVTGLRPTFGRVGRGGAMALSWTMDKVGPITRHVEDAGLVLRAISGPDADDPACENAPFDWSPQAPSIEGLRFGIPAGSKGSRAVRAMAETLGLDLDDEERVRPLERPAVPAAELLTILEAEAACAFDELTRSNRDDELVAQAPSDWANSFRTARFLPAVEYLRADRFRFRLMREMDARFDAAGIDVILTPSFFGGLLTITNLTGHPTLCMPVRKSGERPINASLIGRLWGEAALVDAGRVIQAKTDHHRLFPKAYAR